jgi:hypothetical protein
MNQLSGYDLSSKAMLVILSVKAWGGQRLDRNETARVAADNGASKDALRVTKDLVGDALDELRSSERAIRAQHRLLTVPWADDQTRLLPTKLWEEYQREMRNLIERHTDVLIPKFLDRYHSEVIPKARRRLGDLFREEDFPSSLDGKFGVGVRYLPVPEVGDVRVGLSKDEVAALRNEVEEATRQAYEASNREIVERATRPLSRLAEALREYGPGKRMSKALLNNVAEIAELMPLLDVSDNPFIQSIADEIKEMISGHTTERLSSNDRARKRLANEAQALTAKLASIM